MIQSCVQHHVTAELSDGFVHAFEVQRKGHGLVLTSHTLHAQAAGLLFVERSSRMRENLRRRAGSTEMRIMSFNIWNYNGNWRARAVLIADVIEAGGAGGGGSGGLRDV
jgi:hypothetical protein